MNLYRVTCRGLQPENGVAYVVADDPAKAYEKVRADLNNRDIGFPSDRELSKIELLAQDAEYPDCKTRLYLK